MMFFNKPRAYTVVWVRESVAQRILAQLNNASQTSAVFTGTKFGTVDCYNVYEVRSPQLVGYMLECYAGGAYIVRPKLPSEATDSGVEPSTVKVKPHLAAQAIYSSV